MENLSPYLPPLSKVFSKQTSEDNMDTMHNTSNSEESAQTESARKSASGSKNQHNKLLPVVVVQKIQNIFVIRTFSVIL